MLSVAIIGPDGAGKTTIARILERSLPVPAKYIYMGVSAGSSNILLPTTRLAHWIKRAAGAHPDNAGPPDPAQIRSRSQKKGKHLLSNLRAVLRLANRLGEETFRQAIAWYHQAQGRIVLFDRHFYSDYHAYDIAGDSKQVDFSRRIHGFFLEHVYPKPELVIYLDAPAEVLYARKGEGSVAALERRQQDYLLMKNLVPDFYVVDATQSLEMTVQEITQIILCHPKAKKPGERKVFHAHE